MKKVALVYDFLKELGGLERVMFFQANKLKRYSDIELLFSYVSDKNKDRIVTELELDKSIKIRQIGKTKNEILQFIYSLLFPSRIKKINCDLIIAHSFMASRMAYKKKIKDKTPYISIIYHPPNFLYSDIKGWVNNPSRFFAKFLGIVLGNYLRKKDIEAVRGADLVIAISDYTAKRVKEIYKLNPNIIYPQISSFFRTLSANEKKSFLNRKKMDKKFLYAHGRIIPDKNYGTLLNFIKDFSDYELIISGTISEKYKEELEDKINLLGIKNRVKILGRISREDLLGYYNCAELFLVPAEKEDFGLTIVEAIACGCPVVAWDDGAGPSEIVNQKNGLLAKPYALSDFSFKVKMALNKKWNKQKIAKSVEKFSEKEIEKKFISTVENYL